ncbi:hypothetical protein B0H17DRAFT_1147090 [Mycena rosella]|uniref:Uncharacterized protein n=1 Tax=Mycena rosella TaxID=1033263 RepID=A0AAD7CME5_MYCRO|nr:hypothetical protein B0H17DRAFT_1147090 [Mycena rosella]
MSLIFPACTLNFGVAIIAVANGSSYPDPSVMRLVSAEVQRKIQTPLVSAWGKSDAGVVPKNSTSWHRRGVDNAEVRMSTRRSSEKIDIASREPLPLRWTGSCLDPTAGVIALHWPIGVAPSWEGDGGPQSLIYILPEPVLRGNTAIRSAEKTSDGLPAAPNTLADIQRRKASENQGKSTPVSQDRNDKYIDYDPSDTRYTPRPRIPTKPTLPQLCRA